MAAVSFKGARLGLGEWLIGVASAALMVDLFAVTWFQYKSQYRQTIVMLGQAASANGWQTFTVVGPLTMIVCVCGMVIWLLRGIRRSPAVPIALTTLLAPVSLLLFLWIAVRVLIDQPSVHLLQSGGANALQVEPGAYVALALSAVVMVGIYVAFRHEGVPAADSPALIETFRVGESQVAERS